MVKVSMNSNLKRVSDIVDENATVRSVLEKNGIEYSRTVLYMDAAPMQPGDLDKTFAQLGIADKTFINSVAKADNA